MKQTDHLIHIFILKSASFAEVTAESYIHGGDTGAKEAGEGQDCDR